MIIITAILVMIKTIIIMAIGTKNDDDEYTNVVSKSIYI